MGHAIPTYFDGIEYRSRLEARWAALFTELGWEHIYEPFDGDGYIPDFVIQGDDPLLVEVKPALQALDYQAHPAKIVRGVRDVWKHDIFIVGMSPFPVPPGDSLRDLRGSGFTAAGLLGQSFADEAEWGRLAVEERWAFDDACWVTCFGCGAISVNHASQSYRCRPCGCCYTGNDCFGPPDLDILHEAWADACNAVKWRGRPLQ